MATPRTGQPDRICGGTRGQGAAKLHPSVAWVPTGQLKVQRSVPPVWAHECAISPAESAHTEVFFSFLMTSECIFVEAYARIREYRTRPRLRLGRGVEGVETTNSGGLAYGKKNPVPRSSSDLYFFPWP